MNHRLIAPALAGLLLASCTAIVTDPDETVASFNLHADSSRALVAAECVALHGDSGCTPYPNALECDTLSLEVKADGRTYARCRRGSAVVREGFEQSPAVPFMCKADPGLACVVCVDTYGNTVHDGCNRNTQAFRSIGGGWGSAPPGTAFLTEGEGGGAAPAAPPAAQPSGPCAPDNAVLLFATELNKVLAAQGFNFSWAPNLDLFPDASGGFFGAQGIGAKTDCASYLKSINKINSKLNKCVSGKGEGCSYCFQDSGCTTCRCYRINIAALRAACGVVPAGCDEQAWSAKLMMAYGIATKWLFEPSHSGVKHKLLAPGAKASSGEMSSTVVPDGVQPNYPTCIGSPLVLDLAGDGVRPTSAAGGVRFDLLGHGPQRTAWVRGDDALLALDRDGDGKISSGAELFGEATAGLPYADGFTALATLDANGDGQVDRRDPAYGALLLWRDEDGDGVSQPGELSGLARSGVSALQVRPTRTGARDEHGNDLGLQAGFTRADGGRGLLVDVFFVNR